MLNIFNILTCEAFLKPVFIYGSQSAAGHLLKAEGHVAVAVGVQ